MDDTSVYKVFKPTESEYTILGRRVQHLQPHPIARCGQLPSCAEFRVPGLRSQAASPAVCDSYNMLNE